VPLTLLVAVLGDRILLASTHSRSAGSSGATNPGQCAPDVLAVVGRTLDCVAAPEHAVNNITGEAMHAASSACIILDGAGLAARDMTVERSGLRDVRRPPSEPDPALDGGALGLWVEFENPFLQA
jgi:hypothetical protein